MNNDEREAAITRLASEAGSRPRSGSPPMSSLRTKSLAVRLCSNTPEPAPVRSVAASIAVCTITLLSPALPGTGGDTLDAEDRNIVGGRLVSEHLGEHRVAEVLEFQAALGTRRIGQALEARVERGCPPLDEPVGVQQQARADGQRRHRLRAPSAGRREER